MTLCSSCVAHPSLKQYIETNGNEQATCDICGASGVKVLGGEYYTREFRQLFKALIRYHHSEWEYNSHFGGDHLCALFNRPSKIINWRDDLDELDLEHAILPLIEKVYEDDEEGISLFAGYDADGMNYPLLEALGEAPHSGLESLQRRLRDMNYFLLEDDARKFISKLVPEITREVPAGEVFFRARIGFSLMGRPDHWSLNPRPYYRPYSGAEIGAPPPIKSLAGRLNRHGTSFLYVASNMRTAVAEVRPHPGQPVSIGKFQSKVPLRIADFTDTDYLKFSENDDKLEDLHLLSAIGRMFREPISPENRHLYFCPQLFSDVLRQLGYDAIKFDSSVAEGKNLTIFDPSKFEYISAEAAVHVVQKVKYYTDPQHTMTTSNDYLGTKGYGDADWHYEM